MAKPKQLITVEEASILLETTIATVRTRIRENSNYLNTVKIKNRLRIIVDEVFEERIERIKMLKEKPVKWI